MTHQEWIAKYQPMREIADRVRAMRHERYVRLCKEAHVAPGCVLHNALIGFERGKPWREVDYSKARAARRVERSLYEPSQILARFDQRARLTITEAR